MFSTINEISDPILSFLSNSLKLFLDFVSIDNGETATGKGFRLPLVISTSINPNDLIGFNKIIKQKIKKSFVLFII